MKKLSFLFFIFMILFVTGCSSNEEKVVATLDDFSNASTSNNFVVDDTTDDYKKINYIVGVKVASLDDIRIEMFEYNDTEYAKKVHEEHMNNFNLLKATGAFEINDSGKNYHKYELVSNGYFMISTQVENTVVFCKTLLENKATVEAIFSKIGY